MALRQDPPLKSVCLTISAVNDDSQEADEPSAPHAAAMESMIFRIIANTSGVFSLEGPIQMVTAKNFDRSCL